MIPETVYIMYGTLLDLYAADSQSRTCIVFVHRVYFGPVLLSVILERLGVSGKIHLFTSNNN